MPMSVTCLVGTVFSTVIRQNKSENFRLSLERLERLISEWKAPQGTFQLEAASQITNPVD